MLRIAVVLLVALVPLSVRAAPVTVEFEGVITGVSDPVGLLSSLSEGDGFSGFYTYDDAAPPFDAFAPIWLPDGSVVPDPDPAYSTSEYRLYDEPAGMFVEAAGVSAGNFRDASLPLLIHSTDRDDHRIDDMFISSTGVESILLPDFTRSPSEHLIQIELAGPDLLSAVDPPVYPLPIHVPDLSRATIRNHFAYVAVNETTPNEDSFFVGSLTLLRAVPEPTALMLLGMALGAGLGVRRRG